MIKRRRNVRRIIPRLLVVCEGEVTERLYFEGLRKFRRIQKELLVLECGAGVPKTLVEKAIELKRKNVQDSRDEPSLLYDQIWCVFDRDDHPNIAEAKQQAKANRLRIAFSNPSFELFLLLHCADCNRELHRDAVRAELKKHIPDYDKSFEYLDMHDLYPRAKARAAVINGRARLVSQIETAPFCSVPSLIDQLRIGM